MVYADREFHAADVVATLESKDLNCVIPAMKSTHIKSIFDRFDQLKNEYDEERDTPLYVETEFPMHGRVMHDVSNAKVYTNVVVLPPDDDEDVHEDGSPQPFLTNLDVSDGISLDRQSTTERIEEYQDRAAIENSYSSISNMLPFISPGLSLSYQITSQQPNAKSIFYVTTERDCHLQCI